MKNKGTLFFSFLGALLGVVYLVVGIVQSTNSTSSIGLLFLPVFAFMGALGGYFLGFVLDALQLLFRGKISIVSWRILVSSLGILLFSFGLSLRQQEKTLLLNLQRGFVPEKELLEIFRGKYSFFSQEIRKQVLLLPNPPLEIQDEVLASGTKDEIGLLGESQGVDLTILEKIVSMDPHYATHFGAAENLKLNSSQVDKLLVVDAQRFPSETEFHLYQTFVLAKLVKRKDFTSAQFQVLSQIRGPEVNLLYAMLESPFLTCANFQKFDSKGNDVVEAAISSKKSSLRCL